MRRWLGILMALLMMGALHPGEAFASCAKSSPAENIGRAQVILFGKVTEVDERNRDTYFTVSVQTVYKGQPENPAILHVNSGKSQSTSVDYRMRQGELHTLYLSPDGRGYYTTNACTGSHPGEPTAEEAQAGLGAGQPGPPEQPPRTVLPVRNWIPFIAIAITAAAIGGVLVRSRLRRHS